MLSKHQQSPVDSRRRKERLGGKINSVHVGRYRPDNTLLYTLAWKEVTQTTTLTMAITVVIEIVSIVLSKSSGVSRVCFCSTACLDWSRSSIGSSHIPPSSPSWQGPTSSLVSCSPDSHPAVRFSSGHNHSEVLSCASCPSLYRSRELANVVEKKGPRRRKILNPSCAGVVAVFPLICAIAPCHEQWMAFSAVMVSGFLSRMHRPGRR